MNTRLFNKEDYAEIKSWADKRKIECPPMDFLSDVGFIIDGKCACFVYSTNSKVCFLECFISNNEINKIERKEALNCLINESIQYCKDNKFKYICTNIETESLKDHLKEFKFLISEKSTNLGLRIL